MEEQDKTICPVHLGSETEILHDNLAKEDENKTISLSTEQCMGPNETQKPDTNTSTEIHLEKHSLEGCVEGDQNEIENETDIKEVKCEEKTTNTVESDNTHKIEHENICGDDVTNTQNEVNLESDEKSATHIDTDDENTQGLKIEKDFDVEAQPDRSAVKTDVAIDKTCAVQDEKLKQCELSTTDQGQQIQTQFSREESSESFYSALSSHDTSVKTLNLIEEENEQESKHVVEMDSASTNIVLDKEKSQHLYPKLEADVEGLKKLALHTEKINLSEQQKIPRSQQNIQPLTLEQLKSLYYNPRLIQIDAIVDLFVQVIITLIT